jgi:hypothetical protein
MVYLKGLCMAKYRFGLIFDLDRHLKRNDPTGMFAEVDKLMLLEEIVKFLTEDVKNVDEGHARVNEIEYFMNLLYDKGIIQEYIFHQNEPYLKVCGILFSICESIVDMFYETRFYEYCTSYLVYRPKIIKLSRHNFIIMVKHKLR